MSKITKLIPKSIKKTIKKFILKKTPTTPEKEDKTKRYVTNKVAARFCTGCGACNNSCPVDAITMQADDKGFIHPVIDDVKCVNCGLCSKACPVLHPQYKNKKDPECRAIYAVDSIRMTASSGGIFTAFAEKVLARGGYICGAAFKKDFFVEHIISNDINDLDRIKGSKYAQSDTANTFSEVKTILEQGHEVLYCGTPCQIAGLYSYLGKTDTEKLYTMDLLCHGVPSHKVLKKYLDDCYPDKDIDSIDFRDKTKYGWSTTMTVKLKNGDFIREDERHDPYFKAFLPCMSLRKSCASCKFSTLPRQGDLSIGDFWGIDRYDPKLNDRKGTSVVLVNNKKGQDILEQCSDVFAVNEVVPIEYALHINKTIKAPFQPHPNRDCFFDMMNYTSFSKCVDTCLNRHYDVGIVGLWYGLNYGSIMTYYALYSVIESLGHSCILLKKPHFLWTDRYSDPNTIANKFMKARCMISQDMNDIDDIYSMNDLCDSFVVGSDVVWNHDICGNEGGGYFFLDFADDDKKKISYASSFGRGYDAPARIKSQVKKYLARFDAVSVREDFAQRIVRDQFNRGADKVLDSVFLADRSLYCAIADTADNGTGNYVTAYILGADQQVENCLKKISGVLNKETIIIPNPNEPDSIKELMTLPTVGVVSVEEWLSYIKNCDFYVGDSFHGICFAIIFEKPFVALLRRGAPDNCRYETLLGLVGLTDRIHYLDSDPEELEKIINAEIDYGRVYSKIQPEITRSRSWLAKALAKESVSLSDKLVQLKQTDESLSRKIDIIIRYLSLELNMCNDLNRYLDILITNQNKYIVFIAAMDTPGIALSQPISDKIQRLGASTPLINKHWFGYLAVLAEGRSLLERSEYNHGVSGNISIDGINCELVSQPYEAGNMASILIDGKDHCINSRGLNFVVYDREKRMVCDSVCFDTHFPDYSCKR